jgi:hypothetical protein
VKVQKGEYLCEDPPLPLAHVGDKKVKRFHFSEIIGGLPYMRATVTIFQAEYVAKTSPGGGQKSETFVGFVFGGIGGHIGEDM